MPRRAWLLITPEMMNALADRVRLRRETGSMWAVENALPEDATVVLGPHGGAIAKPARNGAYYLLVQSETFADVSPSDYPQLLRPHLISNDDANREALRDAKVVS